MMIACPPWCRDAVAVRVRVASGAGAFSLGIFTVACVAGRLIGGWLMDTMSARWAFVIGLACYLFGSIAALRSSSSGHVNGPLSTPMRSS